MICLDSSRLYAADQPAERITLNALLEGHPTGRVVARLLPEFENATGINVNIEVIPFEAMTKKARETLGTQSDTYDVFMDGWSNAVEWAEAGHLQPLDDYIGNPEINRYADIKDFVDEYISASRYKGKQYGLPMYGESTFLYYRKDLFAEYGIKVPETMEEVRDAARQIKQKSRGSIYGITLRGREGIHSVYAWSSFLWAFGGHWIDKDGGRLDIDTPEAAAATKFYADLLLNYGPPAFDRFGWIENRDLFKRGKAAMSIDATVNGAFNEDPGESLVAGKTGYIPTPKAAGVSLKGGPSSLVTHQMYISKYSRHREAAFLFISWATSGYVQMKGLEIEPNCGLTSRPALYSPLFQKKYGAFMQTMLESLKNGNPDYIPATAEGPHIIDRVSSALSGVLSGKESAEKALKRVNSQVNREILKK